MALIIKCRKCSQRIPEGEGACPRCGCADYRFIVDYWPRGRNGGRRQISLPPEVDTQEAAREMERTFLGARKRSKPERESRPSMVADLFPEYLTWYRQHRAELTWKDVSGTWDRDLQRIFGPLRPEEITSDHYSLYQQFRGKTVSNRTVNKELDYFSGFLRWCRKGKRLPIERIEYEKLPSKRPLPIILSRDEVERFLQAVSAEPVYHALFQLLYTTGVRKTSATTLRVDDFDFENRMVRVIGKGGQWKLLPINDQVVTAVHRAIAWREEKVGAGTGWLPTGRVFSLRKDGEPIKNFRRAILRICAQAGIQKRVHAHLLRHSIATHMLAAGVSLRTIQEFLGHSASTITEIYTHVDMACLRDAQKKVGLYGDSE